MANPSFRSSANAASQAGATFSVTKPAGTLDGDMLVAFQTTLLGGGSTPATPTGFTLLGSQTFSTSNDVLQCFYKFAASEGANYTFNNAGGGLPTASVYLIAVQGAPANTLDLNVKTSGSSGTADPGAGTTAFINELLLVAWAIGVNVSGTIAPDASFTALGAIGGANGLLNVGYKPQAAAGNTANTSATLDSSEAWGAYMTSCSPGSGPIPMMASASPDIALPSRAIPQSNVQFQLRQRGRHFTRSGR